ncbi:hypothetical protein RF11_08821 [Thelohanellus kitauei]|uniref:Uncharacterized protein n=1 Tax=Thelohanellus kitauei TaxID=669202 RepID=A0A0C2MHZ0_THEKT|nr:hypothetical protein RF11_08821 [Thelohanellus kitauei]
MGRCQNGAAYVDNKIPDYTPVVPQPAKKKNYLQPTQRPIEAVRSSFTALDVENLASQLYEDSGLLMRGNVIHDLYDPTSTDPSGTLLLENQEKDDIDEFDYKSLSYEEKKLLLQRLIEAEEKGFSPIKEPDTPSSSDSSLGPSPPYKPKRFRNQKRSKSISITPPRLRKPQDSKQVSKHQKSKPKSPESSRKPKRSSSPRSRRIDNGTSHQRHDRSNRCERRR